ncbi:hypothetical protein CAJAP_08371 [Camponotus japonicus]
MEKTGKEMLCTPRRRGRRTGEELRARERSNSASILDYVRREEDSENELSKIKRKREEKERETQEVFKRSNMMERTPPGDWREEKDGRVDAGKREEDGALLAILREIKEEMADMRKEVREMKEKWNNLENGWKMREKRIGERMGGLEERLSKIEQRGSNKEEEEEERTEKLVGKIIEKVKKKERMIEGQIPSSVMETREEVRRIKKAMKDRERKERRNNLIIKGLEEGKKNIFEMTREFLEEFGVREGVKRIQAVGKEGREMIIVEMNGGKRRKR